MAKWVQRLFALAAALVLLALVAGILLVRSPSVRWDIPDSLQGLVPAALKMWAFEQLIRARLSLPPGYRVSVFAANLSHARVMRFASTGDLLVSRHHAGRVDVVHGDRDGDGRADGLTSLLQGLKRPNGLLLLGPWLYVAEFDRVRRWRYDPVGRRVSGAPEVIYGNIPDNLRAGIERYRTLELGPDGMMYMQIGSTCDLCLETDERYATLIRFWPDGSGAEIYASGLRNTMGWDWQPGTGDLYGVDNGPSLRIDGQVIADYPPDELNLIEAEGFYGWPYRLGFNDPAPGFGGGGGERERAARPPVHVFGAHKAPLSLLFMPASGYPGLENAALVALHGSRNSSFKQGGYEVVSLHWGPDGRIEERRFLHGFELDHVYRGRPVDLELGPDGAIYLSDDHRGAIYRIARTDGRDTGK